MKINNCANNVATVKIIPRVNHTTKIEYSKICTDIKSKVRNQDIFLQLN